MNPALPLLLACSLAGLAWRRRDAGFAWAWTGLFATALLTPALVLPDGIPSPSASLSRFAPWQAAGDPAGGRPDLVDVTFQVEPWLIFLRAELRAGRLPFWNPFQSSGAPFWSNGSSAPLHPLHWLFAALPLQLGFVLLPWLRLVIGGLGAYLLARELGVSHRAALLAAVTYPLSGRPVSFLLFPMANAVCLVPWIFLALERIVSGRRGWSLLALAGGLQLVAGHPETPVFTALATGIYLLARGGWRTPRVAASVASAWAVGALLAGAALAPLALNLLASSRWHEWNPGRAQGLTAIFTLWLRFLLPDAFGHAADGSWWGPYGFMPTTVYAGALALPLACAGLFGGRRDPRLRALGATVLACLLAAYHFPGVRELLFALPVIQKGLHHYLLPAVALGLAVLAAAGLDRWREGKREGLLAGAGLVALGLGAGWAAFGQAWVERGVLGRQAIASALAAGAALVLLASLRCAAAWRERLAPLLLLAAGADLVWTHARSNPGLPLARLYPQTPAVSFIAGRPERVAALGFVLRPNAAMAYRLYDVRGDDSLKLRHYEERVVGELGGNHPTFFQPPTRWQSPWLDRLGVRWVMAPPHAAPADPAWRVAYSGPDATVFERPTALPLARIEDGSGRVEVLERGPGLWDVEWESREPGRLVVAETWDPGWRATLRDGRAIPVEAVDGVLIGLRVGPGAGRATLRHVPAGMAWGAAASLAGMALLGLGFVVERKRVDQLG